MSQEVSTRFPSSFVYYLTDLHRWAQSHRGTSERIEAEIPEVSSLLDRRPPGEKHLPQLLVQLGIITVAFLLALLAHIANA